VNNGTRTRFRWLATGAAALVAAAALAASAPEVVVEPQPGEFVIGVEDVLKVLVWKEPDLTVSVRVRPDGKITVPLLGDVQADGRTPRELTAELSESLSRFIKEPVVTVMVEQINNYKVYVLGEVGSQGVLTLGRPTRLLQALAQVGGLSQYADKSSVVVIREVDGAEVRIPVDYRKLIKGQPEAENIFLRPGDTILVE